MRTLWCFQKKLKYFFDLEKVKKTVFLGLKCHCNYKEVGNRLLLAILWHRACSILLSRPRLLLFANRERARTRQKLSLFAIGLRRRRGAGTEAVASALEAAALTAAARMGGGGAWQRWPG